MSPSLMGRMRQLAQGSWFPVLVAAVLALSLVGGRSLATDEAFSWGIAAQPDLSGFWDGLKFVSGNMTAYLVLLRPIAAVSEDLVWLRLPSVISFVAMVAVLFRLADRWFDRRTATITALLAATSVPLLYYALEVRSYSFVALMAVVTWYFLERALDDDRPLHWLLFGLAGGLAVSGHVIMALALPSMCGLIVVIRGLRVNDLIGSFLRLCPLAAALVPSIALIAIGDGAKTDWIPGLGPTSLARAGRLLIGDHAQFTSDGSGFILAAAYSLLYATAVIVALRTRDALTRPDLLAWVWLLGLPATIVLVSLVEPLLWHRYLIGALPGGLLVIGRTLARLDNRRLAYSATVLLAVLGVVRSVALRSHSADEYAAVAAAIEDASADGDTLVTITPWTRAGLDYYWRDGAPVDANPPFGPGFDRGEEFPGFGATAGSPRILVFDRSDSSQVWVDVDRTPSDFDFDVIEPLVPAGYDLVDEIEVQRFRVRIYELTG